MEQQVKIQKSDKQLLVKRHCHTPIIISTFKRPKQTKGLSSQLKITYMKIRTRFDELNDEIEQTLRQKNHRETIAQKINENKIFKEIDIFYRPVLNVYEPFNQKVYEEELYRLQLRQIQAEKIVEELNEDREKLEEYKKITTSIKYKELPLKRPKCTDQTSPIAVSLVNADILSNLIC